MNTVGTNTRNETIPSFHIPDYEKLDSQDSFELAILAYNRDLLPLETYRDVVRAETALRRAEIGFCPQALLRYWYRDLPR